MQILFISQPAGYRVAVDDDNLPLFHYRHYPDGTPDDGDRYRGYIPEDQLYWLERDLAHVPRDRLIVIASHIPLVSEAVDGSGEEPATGPYTENFTALLEILEPFEHIYNDAMMQDGTPNGFYLLRFDDVELVPDFHPFPYGADANRHLRVMLDPPPALPDADSVNRGRLADDTKVVVNLFDGGPRDSVWMSLNGGERQAMTYRVRTDPLAERLHAQLEGADHAMGRPTRSSHIWEFALPGTLAPGVHHIEVTSENEFGRHRHGHLVPGLLFAHLPGKGFAMHCSTRHWRVSTDSRTGFE